MVHTVGIVSKLTTGILALRTWALCPRIPIPHLALQQLSSSSSPCLLRARTGSAMNQAAQEVVELLQLLPHPEGGYFKETYRAGATPMASKGLTDTEGCLMETDRQPPQRNVCTSIFYMLTKDAPVGYWHMNQSTIVHYWHGGSALTYYLITPSGEWERHVLGPDLTAGHTLQLIVPGGTLKATVLESGAWGLLGEAVAPGFDYRDMRFGSAEDMRRDFPDLWPRIKPYLKEGGADAADDGIEP